MEDKNGNGKKIEFCEFRLEKGKDTRGIILFVKSKPICDFFRKIAETMAEAETKEGSEKIAYFFYESIDTWRGNYWNLSSNFSRSISDNSANSARFSRIGDTIFNGNSNYSFLRHIELEKGIEFLVKEIATKEKLDAWKDAFQIFLKSFYKSFVQTYKSETKITIEEKE